MVSYSQLLTCLIVLLCATVVQPKLFDIEFSCQSFKNKEILDKKWSSREFSRQFAVFQTLKEEEKEMLEV